MEAAEMAGADRAPAEQRRELQLDLGGEGERALGADQDMREVDVVAAGHQRIEIVAADPALHLRETRRDLVGLARAERQEIARQRRNGEFAEDRRDHGAVGRNAPPLPSASSASIDSTFSRMLP